MVLGLLIEVLGRDDLLDDLLLDLPSELFRGDVLAVLSRDDNRVHTERDNGTTVMRILDGDLGLGVRAKPGEAPVIAGLLHCGVELVGEQEGQGQ